MRKTAYYKVIIVVFLIYLVPWLSACQTSQMREYYSEKSNYVTAVGTVAYISFNEAEHSLYIDFSVLTPTFDDTCFKIVGKNYDLVQEKGIEALIQVGDQIEVITAPKYFGDGYVMPIVSISVDGEMLLEFEEGFTNFLEWQMCTD